MKRTITSIFTLLFIVAVALAGDPKVKSIESDNPEAKPGETVTMTITFKGKASSIKSVEMIVREFPYDAPPIIFRAADSKKKVWTNSLPIPPEAPPGKYHLELKVVMESGDQVISDDHKDQSYGKSGLLEVTIQ